MDNLDRMKSLVGKAFTDTPSPFMQWLNPIIVSAEQGHLEFEYIVRWEWLNPIGKLHGGVTAAIIDDVLGATMFSLNEKSFYMTINNAIDYFSTAKEGERIIAEAKIIKKGKQFVNATCEIWNVDKSRLLARVISNLFRTEVNK